MLPSRLLGAAQHASRATASSSCPNPLLRNHIVANGLGAAEGSSVALAAPLPLQRQTRPHPGGAEPPQANRSQARSAGHGHRADGITFWGSPLSQLPLLSLKANGSRCQAACPSSTSCGPTPFSGGCAVAAVPRHVCTRVRAVVFFGGGAWSRSAGANRRLQLGAQCRPCQ